MTERTYHRGAVVSPAIFFKGARIVWDGAILVRWQWDLLRDHSMELTGAQLAKYSKPSRQRRKGPIVRFGRKP
jgi:hypothetical protein